MSTIFQSCAQRMMFYFITVLVFKLVPTLLGLIRLLIVVLIITIIKSCMELN